MTMIEKSILQRNDELIVTIESTGLEGKSVARYNNFVIFVEGGVPQDTLRVTIQKVKKNYAEAKITEILNPSPMRVVPRCSYAGVCGGCKWQHVSYEMQLQFKEQHVRDVFERIAAIDSVPIQPIVGSAQQYFYRNKMEYSFGKNQWKWKGARSSDSSVYLGLHVPQRYDKVLDIEECFLQSEVSNRILNLTRQFAREHKLSVYDSERNAGYLRFLVIRQAYYTGQILVNLVTFEHQPEVMKQYCEYLLSNVPDITTIVNTINSKKAQIAFGDVVNIYHGAGSIEEQLGKYRFTISANSFFQTNTLQTERLYNTVLELGNFSKNDVIYDFYCGTGTIGIYISEYARSVIGIEAVESAVNDARNNAALNNVTNSSFILGDLKDVLQHSQSSLHNALPDAVIVDPPRSGMHPKVVDSLIKLSPRTIVYVSCNPATQARDVKLLVSSGYLLKVLQPIDMFPHTHHIEVVVLLVKK